jgi:hypothetical protein
MVSAFPILIHGVLEAISEFAVSGVPQATTAAAASHTNELTEDFKTEAKEYTGMNFPLTARYSTRLTASSDNARLVPMPLKI